jgi:hypothetical protein
MMENKSLEELLVSVLRELGVGWTLCIIILFYGIKIGYGFWLELGKKKEIHLALAEKEATIQRLSDQLRVYRIEDLKQKGWKMSEIEKVILKNEGKTPRETRKNLEGDETK